MIATGWAQLNNAHADDGITYCAGSPQCRSLLYSQRAAMKQIGKVFHEAGKIISYNPVQIPRVDIMEHCEFLLFWPVGCIVIGWWWVILGAILLAFRLMKLVLVGACWSLWGRRHDLHRDGSRYWRPHAASLVDVIP